MRKPFVNQTTTVFTITDYTHSSLRVQGSVPASSGSELGDHVTAVKSNGGHVPFSDPSPATNGKSASDELERVIQSMAQVRVKLLFGCLYNACKIYIPSTPRRCIIDLKRRPKICKIKKSRITQIKHLNTLSSSLWRQIQTDFKSCVQL